MAVKKPVSFSSSERDQKILNYANEKMNFSIYVKELIEKDMKDKESIKPMNKAVEFDF